MAILRFGNRHTRLDESFPTPYLLLGSNAVVSISINRFLARNWLNWLNCASR